VEAPELGGVAQGGYAEVFILAALFLLVAAYTPRRILWVFAGCAALQALLVLVTLAKGRRTQVAI